IAYPLAVFYKIFKPFIGLINVTSNAMLRAVGLKSVSEHDQAITEDEVRVILTQSAAMGHLGAGERQMLENVLDLEDKIARRHMVRRNQVVYLNRLDSMQTKLGIASESGHTRFPLCEGDLDHVIGIVHIKDVFNATSRGDELSSLVQVAREPLFLPETVHLDALLKEFQRSKNHMVVLVDEYGSTSGIITIENVLEEMVGPIEDEFDSEAPLIVKKGEGRFEVDATCPIEEFSEKFHVDLPSDSSADSVGGLLIAALTRIPRVGEKIQLGGYEVTVMESEATRVVRVLVEKRRPIDETT
ncbi:MAG: hemolysin family protein, partial [Gemmatimonadota bacterium]|nr:hemolysin family protein [Gemmatimonadota bacterium]